METPETLVELSADFLVLARKMLTEYLDSGARPWKLLQKARSVFVDLPLSLIQGDQHKKAFWINLYNGFTIEHILRKRIRTNVLYHFPMFSQRRFVVGQLRWSLDDIEHGILRKNRPGTLGLKRPFSSRDPRAQYQVATLDPRIHFALNCGGQSCPPIQSYSAARIDHQLQTAQLSVSFNEFMVNSDQRTIRCSKIFKWYRGDFPESFLDDPRYKEYRVEYLPHNWSVVPP